MTIELKTFYEVFLKPNLTRLEKQRQSVLSKLRIILFILIIKDFGEVNNFKGLQ